MMRSAACFQRYKALWLSSEKRQHFTSRNPTAEDLAPSRIGAVGVKYILCDIQTDRANLHHGRLLKWCSTPPLWHIDAAGGRPPHQVQSDSLPLAASGGGDGAAGWILGL
jgi:hypothetical protein